MKVQDKVNLVADVLKDGDWIVTARRHKMKGRILRKFVRDFLDNTPRTVKLSQAQRNKLAAMLPEVDDYQNLLEMRAGV